MSVYTRGGSVGIGARGGLHPEIETAVGVIVYC